jgi:hypothetical protein
MDKFWGASDGLDLPKKRKILLVQMTEAGIVQHIVGYTD